MMILAAGDTPAYLGPVMALLVAAGLIGALFVRLRVVPIVGFLLAGVVIGPTGSDSSPTRRSPATPPTSG
ncbi:hypothetical protein PWG71_24480 [Nocardiopsis sp. N85]|uniref:hypothetical protein n=1 Tax=Nocardiopsis sp. N85 TaxID=3029400 RepID=UPI00237F7287|nr:hypothetical protein [Nocardiopsis sp. N85]MDE3724559.1 hypothetical protein [Nocardiopsis sp. N85]